jgi:hypothetical protein
MKLSKSIFYVVFLIISLSIIPRNFVAAWKLQPLLEGETSSDASAKKRNATAEPSPTPSPDKNNSDGQEGEINQRNLDSNGIIAEEPKVYDDALLQQMLQSAQARLAALQILDQTGIASRLGSITGATQQVSSFGLNIQGPSLPQTVATANGATGSTVTTQAPTGTTTVQTSGLPTQNVATTLSPANPPTVTAPAPTTSLPSSFSVSASDILNEQMQLTFEIANVRLLLEGSLTDRFDRETRSFVKPRVTLGFPITLMPDKRHKDAVAIVEVKIKRERHKSEEAKREDEPPAITALLPREKTYNVAAITDRSTSIGGGVVTQVLGVSGSWLRGRKTYYLVQDQDTLALTFRPEHNELNEWTGFLWQFRPVLGQRYVRAGLKQTFVQVAFTKLSDTSNFGEVQVRTYWRRYDRKTGILKDVLPGSLKEQTVVAKIPSFKLVPNPMRDLDFGLTNLEDLGGGQMLVNLEGRFLSGTSVRIGSAILSQGSPNFTFDQERIRFVAPITDLATKQVALVGRDGTERTLAMERVACKDTKQLKIEDFNIKTVDQTNSLVTVKVNDACFLRDEFSEKKDVPINPPLILVVGNRVFGYSEAPIQKSGDTLSAIVPTALLIANPRLTVKVLFQKNDSEASVDTALKFGTSDSAVEYLLSQTEHLILLDQQVDKSTFLLYGNRLNNVKVLAPTTAIVTKIGRPEDASTLLKLELTAEALKTHKQLLLQRDEDRPFLVQLPASESKESKPEFKPSERLTVGADEVVVEGDGLQDLTKVAFKGNQLTAEKSANGKSVKLSGLSASGVTTTAGTKTLLFFFNDKRVEVQIEVVNSKVETVAK